MAYINHHQHLIQISTHPLANFHLLSLTYSLDGPSTKILIIYLQQSPHLPSNIAIKQLPPALTYLSFGGYQLQLPPLPPSLIFLQVVDRIPPLPPNLHTLQISAVSNDISLPSNLKVLLLRRYQQHPRISSLPPSLTELTFWRGFNDPVEDLPSNLTYLSLGDSFDRSIDNVPLHLTHLIFGF